MTWCARCDVLTTVSVGEPCPACGVPALDAAPVSGKARSPIQVLELEEAPNIHIAAPVVETTDASIEPDRRPPRRRAVLSRLRRHPRLIAFALTVCLIGAVYLGARPDLGPGTKADATATPSESPATGPVLGEPANGWAVFALEHSFTLVDLATGAEHVIEVAGSILDFEPAPKGGHIAYTDEARVLYVTTAQGQAPITLATEVNSFSWTPDGDALVVGRSQTDGRGSDRTRIELINLSDRMPLLLMESQSSYAGPVISSGFTHLVTLFEGDTPSVFDLQPGGKPRLIRRDAALLDASSDGSRILVTTNKGQQLLMIDMKTKKSRAVGPKLFLTSAATFSPDGRMAAINATSHFTLETQCEDMEGTCSAHPYPTDQTLWSLDTKTLGLRSVRSWPSPEFATAPVWGPNGWVFLADSEKAVAYSMTDPSKPSVEFITDVGIGTPPKYLA